MFVVISHKEKKVKMIAVVVCGKYTTVPYLYGNLSLFESVSCLSQGSQNLASIHERGFL
jgi:hypothetical protein